MPDPKELQGSRLLFLRTALEFDEQRAFADSLGVAKNTYNAMEKGKRSVSPTVAFALRERHRIPLDFVYYGEELGLPAHVRAKIRRRA